MRAWKAAPMSATSTVPTLDDVRAAARRIAPYLPRTAFRPYPALSEQVGAEVWVKHENHLPTAAFKVRGGVNLVAQLSGEERARGLVSASTGNHGQSIAYAARLFDVRATICVPEGANPLKVASIRALGAEIVVHGADFDEAREHCERLDRRARLPLRPLGQRAAPDRRRRHRHARAARGRAGDRRDRRPDRRRQRRRGRVHRREGAPDVGAGDRRAVGGGAGGLPLLAGGRDRRGPDGHRRGGPRDAGRLRAAAADPARAPRRLRARQ